MSGIFLAPSDYRFTFGSNSQDSRALLADHGLKMTTWTPAMAPSTPYRNLLIWLMGIFVLRVVLQWFLQYRDIGVLPSFDLWHSETLPYARLLVLQGLVLLFMLGAIVHVSRKHAAHRFGQCLSFVGWLYVLVMSYRLLAGYFQLHTHSWFDGAIPTAFHFIIAAFVLVYGSAIKDKNTSRHAAGYLQRLTMVMAYPGVLIGGYLLFSWLIDVGSPLMFSAYLSVLIGATGILLHENLLPNREDWRPSRQDIINDGQFLVVVQVALPAILKGLALALVLRLSEYGGFFVTQYWPHQSPVILQVAVMMVVAEFFRYWIHRAAHRYIPLWKLHAVHHAATKLYTVNVGRFHPLDKALQFLGDTVLFLLIGVSPEVFATYFVVYALNGFYQHSNANVRLGWLNWIIAGPEIHRWHHSATYREANANFGNNLIIWDTVFGTRYLPKGSQVSDVGIGNSQWPDSFWQQLTAPFTTTTEAKAGNASNSQPDLSAD